jgi:YD repeat-containing protein
VANLTWDYDRYGNRYHQTIAAASDPSFQAYQVSLSLNLAKNQITNSGFVYDAAGDLMSNGTHSYSYDADGNLVSVDANLTAKYVFDALNHRVRTETSSGKTEFVFNSAGQRVSEWSGTSPYTQQQGQYYWGSTPIAYYTGSAYSGTAVAHFQHQDWMGTERIRTSCSGSVEAQFTSLPWGDDQKTITGSDTDAYHYATLDTDSETGTDHGASSEGWHDQWVQVPPGQESKPRSLNSRKKGN